MTACVGDSSSAMMELFSLTQQRAMCSGQQDLGPLRDLLSPWVCNISMDNRPGHLHHRVTIEWIIDGLVAVRFLAAHRLRQIVPGMRPVFVGTSFPEIAALCSGSSKQC